MPIKITGLVFDNSDNIVLIKSAGEIVLNQTEGQIAPVNEITKGFLTEPKRAYVDISNATLAGPSKTYELKNSIFSTVKISQFSINPNTVRLVFTYKNENAQTCDFNVFSNNKGIVIRYTKELNKTKKDQVIYSNTKDSERLVFFEGVTSTLLDDTSTAEKEYSLQSKFFVHSIAQSADGIMIKGTGFISLKPSMYLTAPDRLVIDIDDSVLAKNLRNKSFPIGDSTVNAGGAIKERELIRLGQNTQSTVRIVIQGKEAKTYRAVISPDLQNLYIAKRTDIINANITDTKSTVAAVSKTSYETAELLEFKFSNPVAFSAFEENNNLYLDFNNVNVIADSAYKSLMQEYPSAQTVRIALDKYRVVLPIAEADSNIHVKIAPDAKTIQALIKSKKAEQQKQEEKEKTPILTKIKEGLSISPLYKVVIDPGHGGSDVGATRAGIYEKNITLAIAKMVEKNLKAKGVKTTMTMDTDKTVSLQERCDISNEEEPDVFVSVHVNSSVNDAIYGVETHWWKEDSREYAKTVHNSLSKYFSKWDTKDRGLFKSQFYVINHTEAPAILCEIGFISNAHERAEIITQKRQAEIAKAISDGVMEYLKAKGK